MLWCIIHDATTTDRSSLIFLANTQTPDAIIQHIERNITFTCLLCWSTGLIKRNLTQPCTILHGLGGACRESNSAYHLCTYRQINDVKI